MPMVRCSNNDGIYVFILNNVFISSRPFRSLRLEFLTNKSTHALCLSIVDITQPGNLDIIMPVNKSLYMKTHYAAATNNPKNEFRLGLLGLRMDGSQRSRRDRRQRGLSS